MQSALTFSLTVHPATEYLFWITLGLLLAMIVCFIIAGLVGDLNEWFVFGGICFIAAIVMALVTFGSLFG